MSCAGIDYISYTTLGPAARIEYAAACDWMAALAGSNDMQQRTRFGYTGRVYGGAFAGLRGDDEAWVSIAGHRAHAYLQERMQMMDRHARARRIDIQITYPVAGRFAVGCASRLVTTVNLQNARSRACDGDIRRYRCCAPRCYAIPQSGGLRATCLRRMAICPLTGCGRRRAARIAGSRARSCGWSAR